MREPLDHLRCSRWSRSHEFFKDFRIVLETGSTNADLLAAAVDGAPEGTVLVAERQSAGRGRLDRTWQDAPYAGLTFSFLLRPRVPAPTWGWVPLLSGLGVYDAVSRLGVDAALKWPNDLQVGRDRLKAGGILAQAAGTALVVGIGLNVVNGPGELPPGAVALGADLDRTEVLLDVLDAIATRYQQWSDANGDATSIRSAYVDACGTIGQEVQVALPGHAELLRGRAVDIDVEGRLLVESGIGIKTIGAGDVVHVRAGGSLEQEQ